MKNILFVLIAFLLFSSFIVEEHDYNNTSIYCFVLKVTPDNIKKFSVQENFGKVPFQSFITNDFPSYLINSLFVTNVSVVDQSCEAVGLLINDGIEMSSINLENGKGNFYLKPNGILAFSSSDLNLYESIEFSKMNLNDINIAFQSGPMLLHNGIINANFNYYSTNKNFRSGVGIYHNFKGEKFIVFATSRDIISLFDFASFFKDVYGCRNALCTESGGAVAKIPFKESIGAVNTKLCRFLIYQN